MNDDESCFIPAAMSTRIITDVAFASAGNDGQETGLCRREILGVPIDLIDYEAAFAVIQDWCVSDNRQFVGVVSASDSQFSLDPTVRAALRRTGLNLPDGISVILAARLLGYRTRGRVIGPELMLRICDWGRVYGYRHYFYGSTVEVIAGLQERLTQRYPGLNIAGSYCPPFRPLTPEEDENVIQHINACHPDIVWVGLGSTKQLLWMAEHVDRVTSGVMIGVGAAFNFHAGTVKWAPSWVRRCGLEWAYRMFTEPRKILPRTRHTLMFNVRAFAQAVVGRCARRPGI
jgi:N-acetylglucosaminyldiphosphoundecaprenol N-acetyl-beta-D-mannosaminyltransferase